MYVGFSHVYNLILVICEMCEFFEISSRLVYPLLFYVNNVSSSVGVFNCV